MYSTKIVEFEKLIEKATANRNRELGRHEMLMKRLKEEFQHDKVEDLDAEIAAEEKNLEAMKADLTAQMEVFENEFLGKLQEAAR